MKLTLHRQSGAAALAVTVLLLVATSIGAFYLNRSLIFEQKASANQLRSTTASEMAEAGLEWAIGMLNTPYDINASCVLLDTTNISFRRKYTQTAWATTSDITVATNTYPGCKLSGTTLTCSCPDVPGSGTVAADLGSTVLPGFTVAFQAVPSNPSDANCSPNPSAANCPKDAEAVRVVATGCTAAASACVPGTATSSTGPDAVAVATAIVKLRPLLRAAPAAALTCGLNCTVSGSYSVVNTDPGTNGITINAGGTIDSKDTAAVTVPGQPSSNSLVAADASLSSISNADSTCSNSSMFQAYFGSTLAEYAAAPSTKTIENCGSANSCQSLVDAAYADGWRSFYFPDGFERNNSSGNLGTASDPVTLVTPQNFRINGDILIYGMIFANDSNIENLGTGNHKVYGAVVACRDLIANGNGTVEYDPSVLLGVRRSTALAVKVPGSWTDSCRLSNTNPPVLTCN